MPDNACFVKRSMTRKVTACNSNERLLLLLNAYKLFAHPTRSTPLCPLRRINETVSEKKQKQHKDPHYSPLLTKEQGEQCSIWSPFSKTLRCSATYATYSSLQRIEDLISYAL